MTLYDYTLECLKNNGKDFDDIVWIGCESFCITKENFIALSKKTHPDNLYAVSSLPEDLVLVGDDFWLSRPVLYNENFSSLNDIWIFNKKPTMPQQTRTVKVISTQELSYDEKRFHSEHYCQVKLKHFLV